MAMIAMIVFSIVPRPGNPMVIICKGIAITRTIMQNLVRDLMLSLSMMLITENCIKKISFKTTVDVLIKTLVLIQISMLKGTDLNL